MKNIPVHLTPEDDKLPKSTSITLELYWQGQKKYQWRLCYSNVPSDFIVRYNTLLLVSASIRHHQRYN
jgi:hypothetical protein